MSIDLILTIGFILFLYVMKALIFAKPIQIKIPKQNTIIKEEPKKEVVNIKDREGCLGMFNGKEIAKTVTLETGEIFEYVSLLSRNTTGGFNIIDKSVMHICVDGNLLYKLIK